MTANEKKEKNGSWKRKSSILNPDYTLGQIEIKMIDHVLEEEVYDNDGITWIGKGQIGWASNPHWKNGCLVVANSHWKGCPMLENGIYQHAGVRKPSQDEINEQKRRFGYCLEWPQPQCWELFGSIMKAQYINKKAMGKNFTDIEWLYGKGYRDKKGKLDDNSTCGIIGYFIMNKDPKMRSRQIEWLQNQPIQIRAQWAQCNDTFISTVKQQIESGHKKAIINSYLLDQTVYKEIDAVIRPKQLNAPEDNRFKRKKN